MAMFSDNRALGRYELVEQDHIVFADYRRDGERVFIDHVETPPALRGAGAAGRLMEAIAAAARLEGLTLVPICPYAVQWLARHPQPAAGSASTGTQPRPALLSS